MMAQKYENQTQHLFVSSEGGFDTIGTQNHFRINLNSMPFKNEDNTILRMSLKQFNMPKNFLNVNSSNNKVRVFLKGFTIDDTVIPNVDVIVSISEGDYPTHQALGTAFINRVRNALVDVTDSPFTVSNLTFTCTTETVSKDNSSAGDDKPTTGFNDYRLVLSLTSTITNFAWTNPVQFVCLNIPQEDSYILNTTGNTTPLSRDDYFNDSYILLGGARVEDFEGTVASPIWDLADPQVSFSSKAQIGSTSILNIASWFPMNTCIHTNEYVYISSHQTYSQASSSLENVSSEHAHEFITSNILGKAMRHTNPVDGSVHFKITDPSPYFANITASFLNQIEIEVRDHRGRLLSYPDRNEKPKALNNNNKYITPPTNVTQEKKGNTACDLVILMEKYSNANGVDALQGIPPPIQGVPNGFTSNLSINSKCR
jgi:hypothetical protein